MLITKRGVELLSTIKFKIVLILVCISSISCSEKLALIPSEKAIQMNATGIDPNLETDTLNMDTCFVDTTTIDTTNFVLAKNGTVYFQCDFGPYAFTLDSLLINGNFNGNLKDTAFHLQYGIQPNNVFGKHYDYEKDVLQNLNAIDFTITRSTPSYQNFEITTNLSYDTIQSVFYLFENDTLVQNEYPYYNGILIKSISFEMELLFFSKHIGGCYHDEMVWFYYD